MILTGGVVFVKTTFFCIAPLYCPCIAPLYQALSFSVCRAELSIMALCDHSNILRADGTSGYGRPSIRQRR